ncbi:MAG: VanZ family protein [Chloroflexi bacterium]|nr:VanZ family protein [Chloroflexota bacterium]
MSLFSSTRERRLWAWTLLVVAAIYSTLGLATSLAGLLRDSGVLTPLFVLAMLLIGAAVVTRGLKWRPGGLEIAVALGVAAVYGLVFVRMALETERSHLIEYGVVALLIYEALTERASQGRRVPVPALLAFLAAVVIGAVDEGIQWFVPVRVFDPLDILFNALAAFMAVAGSVALAWARKRTWRSRHRPSDR